MAIEWLGLTDANFVDRNWGQFKKELKVKRPLISLMAGAALMSATVAYAAAPLAPGAAAGVKAAESMGGVPVYAWVGGVLVVVGVVAIASGGSNGHGTTSTCAPGQSSCGGGGSSTGTTGTH